MSESSRPGVDFVVEPETLLSAALDDRLSDANSIDYHAISRLCGELAGEREGEDVAAALMLLRGVTDYHFVPDSAAEPFRPVMVFENRRSLIPSDLLPEQIAALAEVAPNVTNKALKARLADVSWTIERRRQDAADIAVHAYCDCVEAVCAEDFLDDDDPPSPWGIRSKEMLVRAARITRITRARLSSAERVGELVSRLVRDAGQKDSGDDFCRIAEVDLDYRFSDAGELAREAERLAELEKYASEAFGRQRLFETAARAYRLVGEQEGRNRVLRGVAGCHEQRADTTDSAMLRSACLRDTIEVLRQIPGTAAERTSIETKLRNSQESIRDEMTSFSTEIDLSEFVENSEGQVQGKSFPRALMLMLFSTGFPTEQDSREQAQQQMREHPLQGLMPMTVHDSQGRVRFQTTGAEGENQLLWQMSTNRKHSREIDVVGVIDPMRRVISQEHNLCTDSIDAMMRGAALIPPGHHRIFARGTVAFISGENIDSASILVPQLENVLRYALTLNGANSTRTDERGLESEATLTLLLNRDREWRPQLDTIFSPELMNEIESLFLFPGGMAVRHELAHGKLTSGGFWEGEVTYACWLILRLIGLSIFQNPEDAEERFRRSRE